MKAFGRQRMALDKMPMEFLAEAMLYSLYTFVLVFIFLKITERRGMRQVSPLEMLVILALGSAVGDVVFYDDVPLLPVLVVLITLALLYRNITWLTEYSEKLEDLPEGKPIVAVEEGQLAWEKLRTENMAEFEFSTELQVNSAEQFGQIQLAIPETNGQISMFYYLGEEIRVGLPILPTLCTARYIMIPQEGICACVCCSIVMTVQAGERRVCSRYTNAEWSKASRAKRLT